METEDSEAKKRLRSEWDLLKKSGLLSQIGCSAGPQAIQNKEGKRTMYNLLKWNALIKGPKNSPYEGYLFKFEIEYTENYPQEPPKVYCKSNIYHMNINTDGNVCVSSLKKDWNKAGNIGEVLLSIFVILGKPNVKDPYRFDLRDLYKDNKEQYDNNAREYCKNYAIKIS